MQDVAKQDLLKNTALMDSRMKLESWRIGIKPRALEHKLTDEQARCLVVVICIRVRVRVRVRRRERVVFLFPFFLGCLGVCRATDLLASWLYLPVLPIGR